MSIEQTSIVGEPDAVEATADEQQAWHDRYAGAMVVGIALVLVALTSVLTVRWFGGLDVITPVGNSASAIGKEPGTVIVSTQIAAFGLWDAGIAYDPEPVDVRSVTPVVVENSADADIVLLRCTGDPAVATDPLLGSACPGAVPLAPGRMVLNLQPPDKIVAVITARKQGVVQIDGFRVDYSLGPRSTVVDAGTRVAFTIGAGNVVVVAPGRGADLLIVDVPGTAAGEPGRSRRGSRSRSAPCTGTAGGSRRSR